MLRINHRYVFSTDGCAHVLYDPSIVTQKIVSFVSYLTLPFFSLIFCVSVVFLSETAYLSYFYFITRILGCLLFSSRLMFMKIKRHLSCNK